MELERDETVKLTAEEIEDAVRREEAERRRRHHHHHHHHHGEGSEDPETAGLARTVMEGFEGLSEEKKKNFIGDFMSRLGQDMGQVAMEDLVKRLVFLF